MGCSSSAAAGARDSELPFKILSRSTPFFEKYDFDFEDPRGVELGKGGFSCVLRGRKKAPSGGLCAPPAASIERYAIKCVNSTNIGEAEREDLMRERDTLQEVDHASIIKLYDFFEDTVNGMFFMVIELLDGGELFDRIYEKQFYSEKDARDTAEVLLDAVAHLHEHNIAHRDLKPENLLMKSTESDSELKLADFGFAVKCYGEDRTEQLGTPAYVAPEILNKQPYGTPVDMWSCGVIIFVVLGGYVPFPQAGTYPNGEPDNREMFEKIKGSDFDFDERWWKDVSAHAKDLIVKLLEVDTKKRLTAKQALRHPWFLDNPSDLVKINLDKNLAEMKKWNARRKFKAAVHGVIATKRVERIVESLTQAAAECNTA